MTHTLGRTLGFLSVSLSLWFGGLNSAEADERYYWSNYAGTPGGGGFADGTGSQSRFYYPDGMARNNAGNLYIADRFAHTIRKMTPAGQVTTLAGKPGVKGWADGVGSAALFDTPSAVAVDASGNVYVADSDNHIIRKITPLGAVSTLAGTPNQAGFADGPGASALFIYPSGVAVDPDGFVYVADSMNGRIRKVAPDGQTTTIQDPSRPPDPLRFYNPSTIVRGNDGFFYIAEAERKWIRKMAPTGANSVLAGGLGVTPGTDGTGSEAGFGPLYSLTIDENGNLFTVDNGFIRKITPAGEVTTLPSPSWVGNYAVTGIQAAPGGDLFLSNVEENEIQKLNGSTLTTVAGLRAETGYVDGAPEVARFGGLHAIVPDGAGGLIVVDQPNRCLRRIAADRTVSTFAGNGTAGYNNGTGTAARFTEPRDIVRNASGDYYVLDGHGVRKVTAAGEVTTFAGSMILSGTDNGIGAIARFEYPTSIAVDQAGNLFVSEPSKRTIRKITPAGVVSLYAGQSGVTGTRDAERTQATFTSPNGLVVDGQGNLLVGDAYCLRKITPAGVVTTVAGTPNVAGNADGRGHAARFASSPSGLSCDPDGNIYLIDNGNASVRKMTPAGVVTTIAGTALFRGNQPGVGEAVVFGTPRDILFDDGKLYVVNADTGNVMVGAPAPDAVIEFPAGHDLAQEGNVADFGTAPLGESSLVRTFTVVNRGLIPLSNLAVSIDGTHASDFSVTTELGSTNLAPGASTTFAVTVAPSALDARTASLHLASNDPNEAEILITLQATGVSGTPPVMTSLPEDLTVEATAPAGALVTFANATATDDWEVTSITANPPSGSVFPLGTHTVTVTAVDQAGHTTSDTFTVTVQDTTAPTVADPGIFRLLADSEGTATLPDYAAQAMGSDNVGITSRIQTPVAGTELTAGSHLLTLTLGDAAGNETAVQAQVIVGFDPVAETFKKGILLSADPAPEGGLVPPYGSWIYRLGIPAISDRRDVAAKVTLRVNLGAGFDAIYWESLQGTGRIAAFVGQPVPPSANLDGVKFKSLGDPVLAEDGSVAFLAKLQGSRVTGATDETLWTDLFDGVLRLALREGSEALPGLKIKAITSVSIRNGELLVLAKLMTAPGSVTASSDTVVLRITSGGTEILAREGHPVDGIPGSSIKLITILGPASGSPGHGRWHGLDSPLAKVTLADGRTAIVRLHSGSAPEPLLTTLTPATQVGLPMTKWATFGLPVIGGLGQGLAVLGSYKLVPNIVTTANDTALLYSKDGEDFEPLVRENDLAFQLGGPRFASFRDPVVNEQGEAAFVATLRGPQTTSANFIGLWRGTPGDLSLVARLGGVAPDTEGQPVEGRTFMSFISYALPNESGPLFTAMLKGPAVTGTIGLYAQGKDGVLRELIRTNAPFKTSAPFLIVDYIDRKVKTIALLNAADAVYGATRSFNATGSVAVLVTFTDKSQAILRLDLP